MQKQILIRRGSSKDRTGPLHSVNRHAVCLESLTIVPKNHGRGTGHGGRRQLLHGTAAGSEERH